ncbi:MAG: phosphodiester glycosidase family protein [Armatimonadetes bacterium]|nr:phosphodiester glycosidase family protein [Armatimonadota bacterium]
MNRLKRFSWLAILTCFLAIIALAQDWQIVETQTIAPGVFYQALNRINPPTWAGVVRIPLPLPKDLVITPGLGDGKRLARRTVSQIASSIQQSKGYVTAAINGDYFPMSFSPYAGDPLGVHIQDGELISLPSPNRSALVGLRDGRVLITRFQFSARVKFPDGTEAPLEGLNQSPPREGLCLFTPAFGKTTQTPSGTTELVATANLPLRPNSPLILTTQQITDAGNSQIPNDGVVLVASGRFSEQLKAIDPNEKLEINVTLIPLDENFDPQNIAWAIGGGPRLLRKGRISVECEQEGFSTIFRQTKHPRTAVGLKDESLIWVVVDGRQPGYSEGMSLDELAEFLLNAGCKDALNLDGGGSSTLFVRGAVVNRPSDGRERPIANALFLLNLFPPQPFVRLWVSTPAESHWLSNTPVPFQVMGEDAVYRLLPLDANKVSLTTSPEIEGWRWDGHTLWLPEIQGEEPLLLTVTATPKNGSARPITVTLCVHPKPSLLTIVPETISVQPGASVKLQIQAFGRERDGRLVPLKLNLKEVQWQVENEIGEVINGTFVAARTNEVRQGRLIATYRGVTAIANLCVGKIQWQTLHEFDDMSDLQILGYPETTKAEGQIVTYEKRSGAGALMLRYDFSKGWKTRTASVILNKVLPNNSCRLAIDVYGDGSGCWLRARLRDAAGKPIFLDFANSVNWKNEWRELEINLPSGLTEPVTLETIYLAVIRDEQKCVGTILLDNLRVGVSGL